MSDHKTQFLQLAIQRGVLKFGEFTLKSGRVSPYFFNAGLFDQGSDLAKLGEYYAATIIESGVQFDILFGPAYKGIPIAAVTAAALYTRHGIDTAYAFNRKEAKSHGEGGSIVGRALSGRVLIIDDVITAGTAIRESVDIIRAADASLSGVLIALDRQEIGKGKISAVQEVESGFDVPVISIATVSDLNQLLKVQNKDSDENLVERMDAYQSRFGVL